MTDEPAGRTRRVVDAVTGALPSSVVRWAAARGAPMARISGRTAVGSAALARALSMVAKPPTRLRLRSGPADLAELADRVGRDVEEVRRWQEAGLLADIEGTVTDDGRGLLERAALIDLALSSGADEATLERAASQGNLVWAALDSVLSSRRELTGEQAAERAGVAMPMLREVWQALGLPPGELTAPVFDQRDVQALRTLGALQAIFDADDLTEAGSVVGRATTEIATALVEVFRRSIAEPFLAAGGTETDVVLRLAAMRDLLVPTLAPLLEVALHRQLEAAIRSELSVQMEQLVDGAGLRIVAIGFADIVGFTETSERLEPAAVRRLAAGLLHLAESTLAHRGGRVVKSIGDAVMFVTGDPVQAALAGVELAEQVDDAADLPPVRVGIAHGPVFPGYADYFGRTVNLASRLCTAARAGEVLLHAAELDAGDLAGAELATTPRVVTDLKGIGDLEVHVVERER